MNSAYVYLQIYRLFDNITPIKADCGKLCNKACCKGDDSGMYLFPGEKKVYDLLNPGWIRLERSDFYYNYDGKKKNVPIAMCKGKCDRYQRPLACRIFPLTPYVSSKGELEIIMDPRAKSICPMAKLMKKDELNPEFVRNVERTFKLLMKNREFKVFMQDYSAYISEYLRFFPDGKVSM